MNIYKLTMPMLCDHSREEFHLSNFLKQEQKIETIHVIISNGSKQHFFKFCDLGIIVMCKRVTWLAFLYKYSENLSKKDKLKNVIRNLKGLNAVVPSSSYLWGIIYCCPTSLWKQRMDFARINIKLRNSL